MLDRQIQRLIGAPGCGKTTACLDIIEQEIARGVDPENIAFMSFSRKAAGEAAERAMARFGLDRTRFPHFRTLHSAAYSSLNLNPSNVMSNENWKEFGEYWGYHFKFVYPPTISQAYESGNLGDRMVKIVSYAKAKQVSLHEALCQIDDPTLTLRDINLFQARLDWYKKDRNVYDFSDFIDLCQDPLDIDTFILDEAQDCSPAQWALARRLAKNAKRIVIAGDDKQQIYDWAGADVTPMFYETGERIILPKSHRLPRAIKALVDRIGSRIPSPIDRYFDSRDDEGLVEKISRPEYADLNNGSSWLLLARNRWMLKDIERIAREKGVVYRGLDGEWSNAKGAIPAVLDYEKVRRGDPISLNDLRRIACYIPGMKELLKRPSLEDKIFWDDAMWPFEGRPDWMEALKIDDATKSYIRDLRRNGEPLKGPGRIIISTVHGAKGGQADNVMMMTDISRRCRKQLDRKPAVENRVLYVAASRAKQALYICQPQTSSFWHV